MNRAGAIASIAGVVVSALGLTFAIYLARGAKTAAQSAQQAAKEALEAVNKQVTSHDLERAIGYLTRLKDWHTQGQWEVALTHYRQVRSLLTDLQSGLLLKLDERNVVFEAIQQVRTMEDSVERAVRAGDQPDRSQNFNRQLNRIQSELEGVVSRVRFDMGSTGGQV
jgi:hypothetical protein